jgi:hypothetical protein
VEFNTLCALQSLHNVLSKVDNYQLNKQRQVANTPDDASHGNETWAKNVLSHAPEPQLNVFYRVTPGANEV